MTKIILLGAILLTKTLLLGLSAPTIAAESTTPPKQQLVNHNKTTLSNSNTAITPRTLNQILHQIDNYYVDQVDSNQLLEAAVKGVFKQLDPHSSYLNEQDLQDLFDLANGSYNGIGIEVEYRERHLVILSTLKNSPAEIAGLMSGDIVHSINDVSVNDKTLDQVSDLIKTSKEKTILKVSRDYYDKPLEFTLEKANIAVQSVVGRVLEHDIGYIRIHSFQSNTTSALAGEIMRLQKLVPNELQALLLDLRDNPGGVLESAVGVSDLFLEKGTIVSTRGRYNDANRQFDATPGDIMDQRPLLVLINKGSASASEIVAGALQENDRAIVLGVQSYGKGSVQSLIPLGNGATAIKLTTALYYTPDGLSINGIGITPDVIVKQDSIADDRAKAEGQQHTDNEWAVSGKMLAERDFQLDTAEKLVLKQLDTAQKPGLKQLLH